MTPIGRFSILLRSHTAAAFRLLHTLNCQSKTWRVTQNTPQEQDPPVPILVLHEIWSYLIDSVLPKFLQTTSTVNFMIIEAALEGDKLKIIAFVLSNFSCVSHRWRSFSSSQQSPTRLGHVCDAGHV